MQQDTLHIANENEAKLIKLIAKIFVNNILEQSGIKSQEATTTKVVSIKNKLIK